MKVIECQDFNPKCPESFSWGHLDSPKLCSVANNIADKIYHSLRKDPNRIEVPGLRSALLTIAELADY